MRRLTLMNNLKEVIKAILFVAGEGVDKEVMQEKLQITSKQLDLSLIHI